MLTNWLNQMVKSEPERSTEKKILEAARMVFFRKGYAGARMQDIADEAGINKALLHYYFRNKETLFEMIFNDALGILAPRVSEILAGDIPLTEKIRSFSHAYVSMALENPFLPLFILNALHTDPQGFASRFEHLASKLPFPLLRKEIEKAVREGSIRPVDPQQLILNIMSLCLFPFVARPAFEIISRLNPDEYQLLLERRKTEVADFILASLRIT